MLLLSASPFSFLKTLDSTLSLLFFLSRFFLLRSVAATIFCGTLEVSRTVVRMRIQSNEVFQYTSLSMTLASSFFYVALAPSSLAISCFWKVLQVLGFDHLSSFLLCLFFLPSIPMSDLHFSVSYSLLGCLLPTLPTQCSSVEELLAIAVADFIILNIRVFMWQP